MLFSKPPIRSSENLALAQNLKRNQLRSFPKFVIKDVNSI
ncbi:hypothetical protein LEP1GSC086_3599 [Leptospira weilii str. LNT 1234]|nr:hypothetical protein LEP1GSC086_3599 [Leptospira weilii str. LNT 1234]